MKQLVLLRHGQSQWNQENRFTGWVDVPLSPLGVEEARNAALALRAEKLEFDVAFTSLLKRAVKTLWIVLEELDVRGNPVRSSYRINERMYGGLQGLNKDETAAKHGADQVKIWRRSYDVRPPPLDRNSLRALVKHLEGISDQDIIELNIPTGVPLYYELDDNLSPLAKGRYLETR